MTAYYQPGRYWGKIVKQALGESKEKKTPFLALSFIVLGKIDPADPDGELISVGESYERTVFLYLTEKTIEYVTKDLERLGFSGDSFAQLDPANVGFHDFTNQETAFLCQHDNYNGKVSEKWSIAREGGGLEIEPLEPKQVRQLDSLFGKHLKTLKKTNGSPPLTQENVATETAAAKARDDDSPF